MTVKIEIENKEYKIFETATHKFKISTDLLEKIKKQPASLQIKIQKGMKQIVDISSGENFDSSWKEIFDEITKE